jgi:hypothetical protein
VKLHRDKVELKKEKEIKAKSFVVYLEHLDVSNEDI